MKYNKGFTLIEMLIVVAIIAILSGVVLAGVSNFQSRARDTRRIGDMHNVQTYLELYFNKCGHYPGITDPNGNTSCTATLSNWASLVTAITTTSGVTSKFPSPQVSANQYCYGVSGDGLKYAVEAALENDNAILHGTDQGILPTGVTITVGSCISNVFIVSS